MALTQFDPGSFRDRTNRVFYHNESVYRALSQEALRQWETLSATKFFSRCISEGKIIPTEETGPPEKFEMSSTQSWAAFLKHQMVPFISYPYEWSFGMLKDAALLQTELLLSALEEDMILKDSSAFNFQWLGAKPFFIDVPSFVRLPEGEPWIGYRQFCQMFLYPLMLQAYKDIHFQPLLRGCIDGLEPENFSKFLSFRDIFRRGIFMHGYLQAKAQTKYADTKEDIRTNLHAVGFSKKLIKNNIGNLQKLIQGLTWKQTKSQWAHYMNEHSYTDFDHESKKSFVRSVIMLRPWNLVWDIGCNVGTFSHIAAENARYVVAMDADYLAIEYLYQELKKEKNTKILPLVCNIADPSPNIGWRGLERKALTGRGNPDIILCLALIHHLVITANIPLNEFISWLAGLGSAVVIEFITKDDPMVKKLLRNKEDIYSDYEIGYFENCLSKIFYVKKCERLKGGNRILYFAEMRA